MYIRIRMYIDIYICIYMYICEYMYRYMYVYKKEQFVLREEKRARTSSGEDVVIFNGKVIPRASLPPRRSSKAAP